MTILVLTIATLCTIITIAFSGFVIFGDIFD